MDKTWKIHFTDTIGTATIYCTEEEFHEAWENLEKDPEVDEMWCEHLNWESGAWEA